MRTRDKQRETKRRRKQGNREGAVRAGLAVYSLREIADALDLTVQRVQQLERRALKKLARHPEIVRLARECGLAV